MAWPHSQAPPSFVSLCEKHFLFTPGESLGMRLIMAIAGDYGHITQIDLG